jgi:S1-C subfamily serine protease
LPAAQLRRNFLELPRPEIFRPPPPKPAAIATVARSSESEPPAAPEKPSKLVNVNGTGFVISTSGHVLTNNHVIRAVSEMFMAI